MNPKFRKAVFVVAYAKTKEEIKYLVLKRKYHWRGWEFPKGGINPEETKKAAAKRETLEETGEKVRRIKRFNFHGKYRYKKRLSDRKDFEGQEYSLFAAEIKFGKIKFDRMEHSGYKWLSFGDALKQLTFQNQKKSLKIVNEWLKNHPSKELRDWKGF